MLRSIKLPLCAVLLALLVGASFATGRQLRSFAAGPIHQRISALPDANLGGLLGIGAATAQGDDSSPSNTFEDVYTYVKREYVDPVKDDQKLSFGAVRTMLMSLDDPKTRFLDPNQKKQVEDQLNGTYTGIGVTLTVAKRKRGEIDERRLAVVSPVPGGPADHAGVRPGDIITYVDKKWVIAYDPRYDLDKIHVGDMSDAQYRKQWQDLTKKLTDGVSLPKALDQLTGKATKPIELTIERPGTPGPITLTLTPAVTQLQAAEYTRLKGDAGYLRITEFTDAATAPIEQALKDDSIKTLVIDLRDNAGGPIPSAAPLPASAQALLAGLTKGGEVGSLIRKADEKQPITVPVASGERSLKLVALLNGGTANVAEVVAAALKEKGGATLVGARTFGDPIYQRLVDLKGGAAMTLTAGKYLAADGADFAGKGVTPDVALETGGPQSDDAAVRRALEVAARAGA